VETYHQYRFSHGAVDVLLEGPLDWIKELQSELGLVDVGWSRPVPGNRSASSDGRESKSKLTNKGLPGPPPDPASIPTVIRVIGSLPSEPDRGVREEAPPSAELKSALSSLDRPPVVTDPTSSDPLAEGWLRALFQASIAAGWSKGLSLELIGNAAEDWLERSGGGLELWLEELHHQGRIARIHRGTKVLFSPTPRWLRADAAAKEAEEAEASELEIARAAALEGLTLIESEDSTSKKESDEFESSTPASEF